MEAHESVHVTAGAGIDGDRYAAGRGHWSYEARYVSEVTFVEGEVLARLALRDDESRRNVVTEGVRLQELIGTTFRIGEVTFAGERSCDPCAYLDGLLGRPVRAQLGADGGLRARALTSGTLTRGDLLIRLP